MRDFDFVLILAVPLQKGSGTRFLLENLTLQQQSSNRLHRALHSNFNLSTEYQ